VVEDVSRSIFYEAITSKKGAIYKVKILEEHRNISNKYFNLLFFFNTI